MQRGTANAWRFRPIVLRCRFCSTSDSRPAIVLAHGICGGRTIPGTPISYFRGIEEDLAEAGYDVLRTEVPATASVPVRAEQLCKQIASWQERQGRRVTLLAHSMGGLDARYAISKLGADSLVETLLTISTPHRGSPIADVLLRLSDKTRLTPVLQAIPARYFAELPDGGRCLSVEAAKEFNDEVRDSPEVRYMSVGGDRGSALRTSPELIPTYAYIERLEGPNDGLVSVQSSRWGLYYQTLDMDHFHQINFPLPHRWITGAPSYNQVQAEYRRLAAFATAAPGKTGSPAGVESCSDKVDPAASS